MKDDFGNAVDRRTARDIQLALGRVEADLSLAAAYKAVSDRATERHEAEGYTFRAARWGELVAATEQAMIRKENTTMDDHNDTLTALHVRQGTKFCVVHYLDSRALNDNGRLVGARERAVAGTYDTTRLRKYTYKHAMDLEVGSVVLTGNGPAVVVELGATPQFGEGIHYKWVVADVTADLETVAALEAREKQAVEAMAADKAMTAAQRVLDAVGSENADKAAALLGPPEA